MNPALVLLLLSSLHLAQLRSIHIHCGQEDRQLQDRQENLAHPDLLVLESCTPEDIDFWLGYLEKRYTRFYTLWLKAVRSSRAGEQRPRRPCPRVLHGLEKLKVSGAELEQSGGKDILSHLAQCSQAPVLDISENMLPQLYRLAADSTLRLNASNSQIREISDTAFSEAKQLKELDLSWNKLVRLGSGTFGTNRKMEKLNLEGNSISFISRQSFLGLRNLRYLNLAGNDIASMWLQGAVFHHLHSLQYLNLSANRMTELDHGLLLDLPNLEVVDLSGNEVNRLSGTPFQNQTRLQFLSLSRNSITSVDQTSLCGPSSALQTLLLEQNFIKYIHPDAFRNLTGLQELRLNRNYLESIPLAVKYLSELTGLNLGENEISELNGDFMLSGSKLKTLLLAGNRVESIDSASFNSTPGLETLDLGRNQILVLHQSTFAPLSALRHLSLAENRLTDINGLLTGQLGLLTLNVSFNEIKWFDMAFFPKGVEELWVQGNHVEELGNYYKLLDGFRLRILDASGNRITSLGQHTFVDSLMEINLSSNNISNLGAGSFAGLQRLKSVDLRNNSLKTIPRNSLKISPFAEFEPEFWLSYNPLVCDCDLQWMSTYIPGPLSPRVADSASLSCSPPLSSLSPLPLAEVPPEVFLCSYTSHCFSLCRCCTFLACDCRMKCPHPCSCFHDQAWNLNMIQCGSRNLTRVLREIPMDSTILYLDDNQLESLGTEKFLGRNRLSALFLNSSSVEQLSNRTFLGLWALRELHLEHNRIEVLPWDTFQESLELEELYLHSNLIRTLANGTFSQLLKLRVLTLHHNQLTTLQLELHTLQSLHSLTLGRNPWVCSCDLSLTFYRVSEMVSQRINQITCSDVYKAQQNILTFHSSCKDLDVQAVSSQSSSSPLLILLLCTSTGMLLLLAVSVLLVMKRNSITRWIFSKPTSPKVEDHSQYSPMLKVPPGHLVAAQAPGLVEYSAYLHYCLADDSYVRQVLAPKLESVDQRYRICLHHRDLPQSCTVGQAISQAVAGSRCLLILASPAYFLSSIPTYELQMILSEVLPRYTSYPVIVAVFHSTPAEMKTRFRQIAGCQTDTWTFLEVSDILFYDRVSNLVERGGVELTSDSSSCSTKSTTASTLPARVSSPRVISNHVSSPRVISNHMSSPRVISNPLDRLNVPGAESVYATVMDTTSEEGEPTYQTVYSDQTVYMDRNLELVKTKPRFRTLK